MSQVTTDATTIVKAPRNKLAEKVETVKQFYREVKLEMKKVTWPARSEVYSTTVVVLLAVFFFSLFLFVVDVGLTYGITKLQALVTKIFG